MRKQKDSQMSPEYYNRDTKKWTTKDPRFNKNILEAHKGLVPKNLRTAASITRNVGGDLSKYKRGAIGNKNIRSDFQMVYAIDPGDGSVGAMNGGVFVVRIKGLPSRLFIEKRFKPDDVQFAKTEIKLLQKLKHPALTAYFAAFIVESTNPAASVYVEFCDRGSLEDLIKAFRKERSTARPKPFMPEGFIWHALIGLVDGLAYLQGGRTFLRQGNVTAVRDWVPILHRDIKPDNILLRSRYTLGSTQYCYCVLSDFGLACEDRKDSDPAADRYQVSRNILGTKVYFAPELCYNPYPRDLPHAQRPDEQWRYFPSPYRHSRFSDVWALGASMFNLCSLDGDCSFNHIDMTCKPHNLTGDQYLGGTKSRKHPLTVPAPYTPQLREIIHLATTWEPQKRPDAIKLIRKLESLVEASGFASVNALSAQHKLPDWATRVHEYSARAEKMYSGNGR